MSIRNIARLLLVIIVGLLLLMVAGCASTKTKMRTSENVELTTKTNETTKTKTVITEKLDTNIQVKPSQVTINSSIEELLKGDTLRAENDATSVAIVLDPTTGALTAIGTTKPREIPVNIDRRTEIESETNTEANTQLTQNIDKTEKESKSGIAWYWYVIACLILLLALLYLLNRLVPKF